MADIPIPQSSSGSDKLPKTRNVLRNCFTVGDYNLTRPGITSLATPTGLARGSFVWNENLYSVYGTTLYRVATDGTLTSVGTIAGNGQIDSAIGFNHAVIVVRETSGKGYTLDASETLTEITDPDFEASNSVTHIDGRFVYIPFDGSVTFFSDVGAGGTIQTLSFFDAEQLPDKNKVALNWKNILWIGGTDSFQPFRNTGATPVPFSPLSSRVDFGYIGGITEYLDTYAFIGREKDQDVGIYLLDIGSSAKISNEYIDSILTTYTETELSDAIGGRFKWRGHDILVFTLARHAFGYKDGWFLLDTRISGDNAPWRAGFITHFEQKYYTARASNLGRLDEINKDYGNPFERSIDLGFYVENNNDFTAQSIELGISQGYNPKPADEIDLLDITYLNQTYDFSAQDANPHSLRFSPDGFKAFMFGVNTDDIFQYTLSSYKDISTASYASISLDTSGQGAGGMLDFVFTEGGEALFALDQASDDIFQYTCPTPYDLTSASYASKSFSLTTETTNPKGISLSTDGQYVFIADAANDEIIRYTITPGDISTAVYDTGLDLDVSNEMSEPRSTQISTDGLTLWVLGSDRYVYQYNLSVPHNPGSGTYALKTYVGDQAGGVQGLTIDQDDFFLYVVDDVNDSAYQYSIKKTQLYPGTVGLSLSRDNVLYSDIFYRAVGEEGRYTDKLVWDYPGGLGYYTGFMGIRLTTTDDVIFSVDKLTVNLR